MMEKDRDGVGDLTQSLQHPADHGGPPVHVQLGAILPGEAAGPCGHRGWGGHPQLPPKHPKNSIWGLQDGSYPRSSSVGSAVTPTPNSARKAEGAVTVPKTPMGH